MGLGGLSKLGLGDARKKAAEQRLLLVAKIDPLARRKAGNTAKKIEAARSMTFDDCAAAYMLRTAYRDEKKIRGIEVRPGRRSKSAKS